VRAFLARASTPIAGLTREQIGEGFLSVALIKNMLLGLHYADLVDLLGDDAPQRLTWVNRIKQSRNPLVFTEEQVRNIKNYCMNYDLVLGLPLLGQP
jgi:hypothetical protein